MISCTFNIQTCYPSDFTDFYNNEYGNCFTFTDGTMDSTQCDTIEYLLHLDSATYPTMYYTNLLKMSSSFVNRFSINDPSVAAMLKENLLRVTISYDNLYYEVIEG